MQITIDSKHDSQEEIHKAIELLHLLAKNQRNNTDSTSNYANTSSSLTISQNTEESNQKAASAFTSMFGATDISKPTTTNQTTASAEQKPIRDNGTAPDFNSYLDLLTKNNQEEKKSEEPKVILF